MTKHFQNYNRVEFLIDINQVNYFEICFYIINNFLNFYVLLLLLLIKDLFQKNDYFFYTFEAQSEDPSIFLDLNSK
jgi:hypothetical protein